MRGPFWAHQTREEVVMSTTDEAAHVGQDAGSQIVLALTGLTNSAISLAESQISALSASLSLLARSIGSLQSLAESTVDKAASTL